MGFVCVCLEHWCITDKCLADQMLIFGLKLHKFTLLFFVFCGEFLGFWLKHSTSVKSSTQIVSSCEECRKKAVDRRSLVHYTRSPRFVPVLTNRYI